MLSRRGHHEISSAVLIASRLDAGVAIAEISRHITIQATDTASDGAADENKTPLDAA